MNGIAVIDGSGDSIIRWIAVQNTSGVVYSAHTGLAYIPTMGRSIVLVDGATDSVRHSVPSGIRCEGFVHNPSGGRVYALSSYSSDVSVIVDSLTGIAEAMNDERATRNAAPTIVRGVLMVEDRRQTTGDRAELLDAGGRKVLDLTAGANDVRFLVPGVYFVREAQPQAVSKVVVTR